MRDRLLIRHFLWRFLENDLISPNADRHVVLSVIGGGLVGVSLFLSILIATPYQFSPTMPPGMASVQGLDDRFFWMSASMLFLALTAVAQWDSLALDPRDTAALGVLPIPRAVIVRTKFVAVALLALGVAVGWNLVPTLLRWVAVPSMIGMTVTGGLVLTLAHGVTAMAAGAFGFLAIFGLREGTAALVGPARFQRISASLQAVLVVVLVSAMLLLPGATVGVARSWRVDQGLMMRVLPPSWFVGLNEIFAGSVLDSLPHAPHGPMSRMLVVPERKATALYRSLWPLYGELAWTAVAAMAIAGIVAMAACLWNGRRLPIRVARPTRPEGAAVRVLRWLISYNLARSSLPQAGFFFTLQTLSRQVSHRVALVSSFAVGLSLVLITAHSQTLANPNDVAPVSLAILEGQSLLLASVLGGFRHAIRLPADLRASSTFSLAWAGNLAPYISGVKLAGWFALVLPMLTSLLIWHVAVLGVRLAVLHFGVGLALSTLLMETLFLRYRRLPFASAYERSGELNARGPLVVASLLLASLALAWIERFALAASLGYLLLLATMIGLSAGVRALDRASCRPPAQFDLAEPPHLPTQRFDLSD